MIELRYIVSGEMKRVRQLEYRWLPPCTDASGGLCPGTAWSDWKVVHMITEEEAAYEDLRASGGLPEAGG